MNSDRSAIPVIMYHSIGRPISNWKWSFLTVPVKIFEDHLKWLSKTGYQTVDLYKLYAHTSGQTKLPERSIVLTFDDGYLDNWTYAAPLLSKYGFKGTVFVNPEFVDPRDIVRPTLKDMWNGKIQESELQVRGFMSWPELQILSREGLLSIQSHAMTHTWYPSGPKIIDFHHPDDGYYWLDWNNNLDKKPFYLQKPAHSDVPYGTPVYENEKSLAATRFFPDPKESNALTGFVKERGGENFLKTQNWRNELLKKAEQLQNNEIPEGCYETPQERKNRYRYELYEAKQILEEKLRCSVDFLCWPGGGYDDETMAMALKIYKAVTLASKDKSPLKNRFAENPQLIRRVGIPGIESRGSITYPGGRYLVYYIEEYQGSLLSRRLRQLLKALKMIKAIF